MSQITLIRFIVLSLLLQLTKQQLLGGELIEERRTSHIIGTVSVVRSTTDLRQLFGEPCNTTLRCDSRKSLRCIEETCKCARPEQMTFDKGTGRCYVLSGERCSYTTLSANSRVDSQWVEIVDCVPNAACASDGYCRCSSTHKETPEGMCISKGLNDAPCAKSKECRDDKNLICVEGKCRCPPSEAVFDPVTEDCVALANTPCRKYRGCVRHARCGPDYSRRRMNTFSSGEYYCSCTQPFKASAKGFCLGSYGDMCDSNTLSPCLENLSCENGRCTCKYPEHQFYDASKSTCITYVHGPCMNQSASTSNESGTACVEHSECRMANGISQCLCKAGYIESLERGCDLEFAHVCDQTTAKCDRVAGLKCKNGICQCSDLQFFDQEKSVCRGSVGALCNVNATSGEYCLNGGTCVGYRDTSKGHGSCLCPEGMLQDPKTNHCTEESQVSAPAPPDSSSEEATQATTEEPQS